MDSHMVRKIIYISIFTFWLQTSLAIAGTTGSEELKDTSSQSAVGECFEGFSRAMFEFNYDLDRIVFQPVAKGYRALPVPIRKGTGNVINNLRSLLTLSKNISQIRSNILPSGHQKVLFCNFPECNILSL